MENRENVLRDKSYKFALRIVKLYKHLAEKKRICFIQTDSAFGDFDWRKYRGRNQAQSKADFVHKLSIAHKEAFETEYWLCLLRDGEFITEKQAESIIIDCQELQKILTR